MDIKLNTIEILSHYEDFLYTYYNEQENWTSATHAAQVNKLSLEFAKQHGVQFSYVIANTADERYQTLFSNYDYRLQHVDAFFNGVFKDELYVVDVSIISRPKGLLGLMKNVAMVSVAPLENPFEKPVAITAIFDKKKDIDFALTLKKGAIIELTASGKNTEITRIYPNWEREITSIKMENPAIKIKQ